MAEAKVTAVAEKREDVYIPRTTENDDPNYFISVNGVNYLLPRGKTSKVPAHIKAEFERAQRAQERLDATIDKMLEASK